MSTSPDQTAVARWTPTAVEVDNFDHGEWSRATAVQLTRYWSGAQAPKTRQAWAKVLWSNNALHVQFNCEQHESLIVTPNPQTREKTIGLWDRDVCEIFIAPDPDSPAKYYEFEAAPTGEWLDVAITFDDEERDSEWSFNSGMTVAARLDGERLLIAMQIPWSEQIARPQPGQRWRVNFMRCIGDGEDRGYLVWQPTRTPEPNFHVPSAFGWLVFA